MTYLKANPGKSARITIKKSNIKNNSSKKLLRALMDNKLIFSDYVPKLC